MTDAILQRTQTERNSFFSQKGELLRQLAHDGQSPYALFIGCADSRVVPEQFMGAAPGDLFMFRNIANLIPPYWQTEIAVSSLLEFVVFDLEIAHIIVCGHTHCGGIEALDGNIDPARQPGIVRWLDLARPAQREVDGQPSIGDDFERHKHIVERNVVHQLRNLLSYPYVQAANASGQLTLHGWVFYLEQPAIGYYDADRDKFVIG